MCERAFAFAAEHGLPTLRCFRFRHAHAEFGNEQFEHGGTGGVGRGVPVPVAEYREAERGIGVARSQGQYDIADLFPG